MQLASIDPFSCLSCVWRAPAAPAAPSVQPAQSGVELVGVDEPTAAVIMAIVSHRSGISLDRLAFKSIKLSEDK